MALIDDRGRPDTDEGEWKEIAHDPDTGQPVELRVREVPHELAKKFIFSRGRDEKVVDPKGRASLQRLIPPTQSIELVEEKALYAWTGARGFLVRVRDDEARRFYEGQGAKDAAVGQEVDIGTCLSEAVKKRVLDKKADLAPLICKLSDEIRDRGALMEEEAEGNS